MTRKAYQAPPGFPEHFRVVDMLQEPHGQVPYADVAFDVGPRP